MTPCNCSTDDEAVFETVLLETDAVVVSKKEKELNNMKLNNF